MRGLRRTAILRSAAVATNPYGRGSWVWDLAMGHCLAVYHPADGVYSISPVRSDGQFIAGTRDGEVIFLALRTLPVIPIVTAVRLWRWQPICDTTPLIELDLSFKVKRPSGLRGTGEKLGRWDESLTVVCYHCSRRIPAPQVVLEAIRSLTAH